MHSPFPGMDPYLEYPALWPDVHNRLIAAIADALTPKLAPRYYIGLEQRTYLLKADDIVFVGRPDLGVVPYSPRPQAVSPALPMAEAGVYIVDVPLTDRVSENYLEVHEVSTGMLVTIMELLSPVNKLSKEGREQYMDKRAQVFSTRTNMVEVDLLRAGEPIPVSGRPVQSDYRILISRGVERPRSILYTFNLRQPIPTFPLPLLPQDEEVSVDLNAILHALYERARFDLRLDYSLSPVPPLSEADEAWARGLMSA